MGEVSTVPTSRTLFLGPPPAVVVLEEGKVDALLTPPLAPNIDPAP